MPKSRHTKPTALKKSETDHLEHNHLAHAIRFEHMTPDDLLLVRMYEPEWMHHVDMALLVSDDNPISLCIHGYKNGYDVIAACIWYALDHGVPVTVTTAKIEEKLRKKIHQENALLAKADTEAADSPVDNAADERSEDGAHDIASHDVTIDETGPETEPGQHPSPAGPTCLYVLPDRATQYAE